MTDSVLFLLLSLLIIAASLYLPEHLTIIANRMFYYLSGHQETLASSAQKMGQPSMADSVIATNAPLGAQGLGEL